jgi:hypothetical protein
VDEFKLKVQGIAMTADVARDQMTRAGMSGGMNQSGNAVEIQRFSK